MAKREDHFLHQRAAHREKQSVLRAAWSEEKAAAEADLCASLEKAAAEDTARAVLTAVQASVQEAVSEAEKEAAEMWSAKVSAAEADAAAATKKWQCAAKSNYSIV